MSKVKNPLFSIDAYGTVSGLLTFQRENVGHQARINLPQKDPLTPAQLVMRSYYRQAQEQYRQLSPSLKEYYRQLGEQLNLTAQQYFVKDYFSLQTIARYNYARYGASHYIKA